MVRAILNMISMPTISDIFVDTSAFVSLWDDLDSNHIKAIKLQVKLEKLKVNVFTSSDVIGETLTVISRKIGKKESTQFYENFKKSKVDEIFISESIHQETIKFFVRIKSKNISFIDCSSVIAMKRNKISVIFSFDQDFKKLGVKLLEDVV